MRRFFVTDIGRTIPTGQRFNAFDEFAALKFQPRNLFLLLIDFVAQFQHRLILMRQPGFEFVDPLFVVHGSGVGFRFCGWWVNCSVPE